VFESKIALKGILMVEVINCAEELLDEWDRIAGNIFSVRNS
jgi:hypothetical protein